jgi:hypothetical protein
VEQLIAGHEDKARFNPQTLYENLPDETPATNEEVVFEVEEFQQMTDPLTFIRKTIKQYPNLEQESLENDFRLISARVRQMDETMDKNKQEEAQRVINVYGFANIGCDQTGATFQTVVQAPPQPFSEAKTEETGDAEATASQEESVETMENHDRQETFADRVKAIVRKAATKNGQRVESNARGHAGAYIYHIDAEAFCKAMDEMVSSYGQDLQAFLGGSLNCVQVTKVCLFIGHVIRMHVINDINL